MAQVNPYRAPQAAVEEGAGETQPVRFFAVSGRIGRLRYIAYGVLMYAALFLASGILVTVLSAVSPTLAGLVALLPWLAIIVLGFMLTIQRCHDFDTTGWLSILSLVPLVNLIFWFIPGTDGPNRYGPPTPPNGAAVIVGAIAVPVVGVAFIGILAAVAIPAYGDYTHRARVSEVILLGSSWRTAVQEHYLDTKRFPSSAAELRGGAPAGESKYGRAALAPDGVIVLTLSPQMGAAADKTILIQPKVAGESIEWDCTGGSLEPKYRPSRCRAPR